MQKVVRGVALGILAIFFIALIAFNVNKPTEYTVWNEAMTLGNKAEAEHHFVMYTDIFCPYCDKFSNAIHANNEYFMEEYINGKKVLFEVRITDMNYESGHSNNSRPAGETAYCAGYQDKFFPYYEALLNKLYEDYHSKGIGADRTSKERIPDLELDYYYDIAEKIEGLDMDKFKTCVENHEAAGQLDNATSRTSRLTNGVPYFVFDRYTTSGFAGNWDTSTDYQQAKLLLDAGLASKR